MENELMESKCRWIPVTERLPEDNDEVLISIDGEIFLCWYRQLRWRYDESHELVPCHKFIIKGDGGTFDEGVNFPSHWMPLPDPA